MDIGYKNSLEAAGYRVIEKATFDPHFRTKTFIQKPDGSLSAFYEALYLIPMNLQEGDEVSTYVTEVPVPAQNTSSYDIHAATYTMGYDEKGLISPFLSVCFLIFIGIVIGVLFMKAFFGSPYNPPPCGETGSVVDIDDCVKMIVYPNCGGVMYDSCTHTILAPFDPPEQPPDWTTGLMWVAIGVIGVAAIIIIPKFIKSKPQDSTQKKLNR